MSKSGAPKAKTERKSTIPTATAIPVTHDLIPGKFTDQDWLWMVERDDSDSFVTDLIDEIYTAADKIIYESYIERQLIPYTIMQAKDALLQIIEWQFLAREEDVSNIDSCLWIQDDEPMSAITDCWAQGAVPQTFRHQPSIAEEVDDVSQVCSARKDQSPRVTSVDGCCSVPVSPPRSLGVCSPVKFDNRDDCVAPPPVCEKRFDSQSPSNGEPSFKMPDPPEYVCGAGKQTEGERGAESDRKPTGAAKFPTAEVCRAKFPNSGAPDHEPKQPNDSCSSAVGDDWGWPSDLPRCKDSNVNVYITKIPPSRLPTNSVNTLYCIVDPKHDSSSKLRTDAAKARKRQLEQKARTQKLTSGQCPPLNKDAVIDTGAIDKQEHLNSRFPLTLDSMHIAPGVTARERDVVKKGPKLDSGRCDIPTDLILRPVRSHNPHPTINVSDIVDPHVHIKPLMEPSLVPPIICSPPISSQ